VSPRLTGAPVWNLWGGKPLAGGGELNVSAADARKLDPHSGLLLLGIRETGTEWRGDAPGDPKKDPPLNSDAKGS